METSSLSLLTDLLQEDFYYGKERSMTKMKKIQREAEEFKAARKKIHNIHKKNRPLRTKNAEIRIKNTEISKRNKENNTQEPLLPYYEYHQKPQDAVDLLQDQKKQCEALSKRTEVDWLNLIRQNFSGQIRSKIACIIFWDYAGNKIGKERWHSFDQYVSAAKNIDIHKNIKIQALYDLGYPAHTALNRIPVSTT